MLRDENRGISGNGRKSYKRYKWFENGSNPPGGGEDKKEGEVEFLKLLHHLWDGNQLAAPKLGGVGVVPIEDQFKPTSGNNPDLYESFAFSETPLIKVKGAEVHIIGKDPVGGPIFLKLILKKGDAILEDKVETIFWIKPGWKKPSK